MRTWMRVALCGVALGALGAPGVIEAWAEPHARDYAQQRTAREQLLEEAKRLEELVSTPVAKSFLGEVARLPEIQQRTMHREPATGRWLSSAEALAMPEAQRAALESRTVSDRLYWNTRYGSPLAYSRMIDVLGQHGLDTVRGRRIMDFGYGTVGHLRLLAASGADVVGLDVDPFLTALYSEPSDTGVVHGQDGAQGRVTLVEGRLSSPDVCTKLGGAFDVVISKNTLKRGYLHPEPLEGQTVDPRMLIKLGMEDEAFVQQLYDLLKPGGKLMIYNICGKPSPPDKPFNASTDGRCPFDRALLERVGFSVVAFDADDTEGVRDMARALGWNTGPNAMTLEDDLFALYTILQKPGA